MVRAVVAGAVVVMIPMRVPGGSEDLSDESSRSLTQKRGEEEEREDTKRELVDDARAVSFGGGEERSLGMRIVDFAGRVMVVVMTVVVMLVAVKFLLGRDLAIEVSLHRRKNRVDRVTETDRADRHRGSERDREALAVKS